MDIFVQMWNTAANYTQWQAIWISSMFLLINTGLCAAVWLIQKMSIIHYGYPKSKQKKVKKSFKGQRFIDKLLLSKLRKEASRASVLLNLCVFLNYVNIVAICTEIIGYIGAIITRGQGWAMSLVLLSGFASFCVTALVHGVGSLIWDPSERKRWQT